MNRNPNKKTAENYIKEIRRKTRRIFTAEQKITIVMEAIRAETSVAELCRKYSIHEAQFYKWNKEFIEAGKRRLAGDITREEGVALVKRFDHEFPERFADEIFRYLSIPTTEFPEASAMFEQPVMDRPYFMKLADTFRSSHLWQWDDGQWKLRHAVWHE